MPNSTSILDPIVTDMQSVDSIIRQRLHSDVVLIRQVAEYIIHSGGKRLRPALLMLCANALGYRGGNHHELAAVIEFIHTATLLHDDVVDESDLRRGNQTANAMFGNPASVLVGDFLYSRAFQMMVRVNDLRVMQVLAEATNVIAEGEVLQLLNCHNADIAIDDYLQVIRFKTAKLFQAATRLGAMMGGADEMLEEQFAAYGMHLGTAFQIADDVLDYTSDEVSLGKHLGDDLAEGKPTLPLIYAMQHGSLEQSARVRNAIESGGRDDFQAVLQIIHDTGALDESRRSARDEAELAAVQLASLPPSIFKDSLLNLCAFAVERNH